MFGRETILNKIPEAGGCTNTVDNYNPFPDGGGLALYQLNGDATDESGNYDGTATNVTWGGAGVFGTSAAFNGSSSIITIGQLVPINSDFDFSFSQWINPASLPSSGNAITLWGTPGSNIAAVRLIIRGTAGGFEFELVRGFNSTIFYSSNTSSTLTSLSTGIWYNLTFTYVSSTKTVKIYLNGVELGNGYTLDTSSSYTINSGLALGAYQGTNSSLRFNGSIDQVRIFSRALRPYEVEALYTEEYCTPTIVPSEHFNTVLYTGTGASQTISGVGFEPDFVWGKLRSSAGGHFQHDSVRGATKFLQSNTTNAEGTTTTGLNAFTSDGFQLGTDNGTWNSNGDTFVAWNFKAGGSAVTNTYGTITSQVSANTEAGFSIVSYTGVGGGTSTVGHGLNQKPTIYITKERTATGIDNTWGFYFVPTSQKLFLNLTNAAEDGNNGGTNGAMTPNKATDTTLGFTAGSSSTNNINNIGSNYIAYCFAEVEGFSNFGSYVGTGNTVNVVTGFEPAMIIIKRTDSIEDWKIIDNKRGFANSLEPNESIAEEVGNNSNFILSDNGFTIGDPHGDYNANGGKYIYMAFAADPTTIEPTLEDSFNTVLYTGNGYPNSGTQSVTGVGFQPDLTWIKARNTTAWHTLVDSVRGVGKYLFSNATNADYIQNGTGFLSFDSDGFSLGADTNGDGVNRTNDGPYVAWNWKGAEIPAINSNGSIPSVVSANPAAGFSIVSYTGNGGNTTIGHGLGIAPNVIIFKDRTIGRNWRVYHSAIGAGQNLKLNTADAASSDAAIFQSTTPTENVFYVGASGDVNANTDNFIAYCFAEVAGFSKFGSYTGAAGQTLDFGFEPAFVMIKRTDTAYNWNIYDNKRGGGVLDQRYMLIANASDSEFTTSIVHIDFTSNGISFPNTYDGTNAVGGTYIYMAFANQF